MMRTLELSQTEADACTTREEWVRLFVSRNPTMHALDVTSAYCKSSLVERLGALTFNEVRRIQAETGAAGMTSAKIQEMESKATLNRAKLREEQALYPSLDEAQLAALTDRQLRHAIIVRLLKETRGEVTSVRKRFPEAIENFRAVNLVDGEVSNGGFSQYFRNQSDGSVDIAVHALREMGANEHADVVERAAELYRRKYPDRKMGPTRDQDFDALDREYYAQNSPPERDVNRVLNRYTREHLSEIAAATA